MLCFERDQFVCGLIPTNLSIPIHNTKQPNPMIADGMAWKRTNIMWANKVAKQLARHTNTKKMSSSNTKTTIILKLARVDSDSSLQYTLETCRQMSQTYFFQEQTEMDTGVCAITCQNLFNVLNYLNIVTSECLFVLCPTFITFLLNKFLK